MTITGLHWSASGWAWSNASPLPVCLQVLRVPPSNPLIWQLSLTGALEASSVE